MGNPVSRPLSFRRVPGLLLLLVLAVACREPEEPPPTFTVFGITDKFFDVEALGGETFLALGYRSKILRSTDGGATWSIFSRPWERSLTRLAFVDSETGWGVGHQGKVMKTTDGGKEWAEQDSGMETPLFDVDFPDANHGFAIGDLSGFTRTKDGGATWEAGKIEMSMIGVRPDMSLAIEDPIFYGIDFLDENRGWVVGEYGQIRVTTDGGETWGAQHEDLLGGKIRDIMSLPTLLCIRMLDDQRGITVGTYGSIITTVDGGETWEFRESPVHTPLYDIRYLDDGSSVITGSSGVILRGDFENGWKSAELPEGVYSWVGALDFNSNGEGIAAGGFGLILTSADGGKTWQQTLYQ